MAVLGCYATVATAQPSVEVEIIVPTSPGNSSQCEALTGCRNVDIYQQVFDESEFFGNPAFDLTGIAFRRENLAQPFFVQFADVEINLGFTSRDPDALGTSFAGNFMPGTKKTVHRGPLTLNVAAGGPAFQLTIAFNHVDCTDAPAAETACFMIEPGTGRNLLFEFKNWSGEGSGTGTLFLDAEDTVGDTVSSVWYEPNGINGNGPGRPNRPQANRVSSRGLVAQFAFAIDPTNLSLNTPAGQTTIVNNPTFRNFALNPVVTSGTHTLLACLGIDPRSDGQQTPLPWAGVIRVAGNCDWLATSQLRFDGTQHGRWGTRAGLHAKYIVLLHQETTALLAGVNTAYEDETTFANVFGVVFDDPIDCNQALPGGGRDLTEVPMVFGGDNDGPNTDAHALIAQCDEFAQIRFRTDSAFPMRYTHDSSNFERFTVQQHINRAQGWITQASACTTDAAGLATVAELNSRLSFLHNAFVSDQYRIARQTGEIMGWLSEKESNGFQGCDPALNLQGAITATVFQLVFALFDRNERRDVYECYQPALRDPGGVLPGPDPADELLTGFFTCPAP